MAETVRVRPPNRREYQPPPSPFSTDGTDSPASIASSQLTQSTQQRSAAQDRRPQPPRYPAPPASSKQPSRYSHEDNREYMASDPSRPTRSRSRSRSYTPSEASTDNSRPSSRASSRPPSRTSHSRQESYSSVNEPNEARRPGSSRDTRAPRDPDDRSTYSRTTGTSRPTKSTRSAVEGSKHPSRMSVDSRPDSYAQRSVASDASRDPRDLQSAVTTSSRDPRDLQSAVTTSSRGTRYSVEPEHVKTPARDPRSRESESRESRKARSVSRSGSRSTSRSVSRLREPDSAVSHSTDRTQDTSIRQPPYDPQSAVSRATDVSRDTQAPAPSYDDRRPPASAVSRVTDTDRTQTSGFRDRDAPASAVSRRSDGTQSTQGTRSAFADQSPIPSVASATPQPRGAPAPGSAYDRPTPASALSRDPDRTRNMSTPQSAARSRDMRPPYPDESPSDPLSKNQNFRPPNPTGDAPTPLSTKSIQGLRRKQVPRAVSTASTDTQGTRDTNLAESPRKASVISEDVFEDASVQSGVSPTSLFEMSPHPTRAPASLGNDLIGRHLLLDTAMNDAQDFQILSMDEVDEHKAKLKKLNTKIFQERRKLAMEMKVQNAAQNLHRLYENSISPNTARKKNRHAMSILIDTKKTPELSHLEATKDEEIKTERKIHELQQFINGMTSDKAIREGSLLRHNAAVLLAAYGEEIEHKKSGAGEADSETTLIDTNLTDELPPPQAERFTVLQGRLEALNTHITAAIARYRMARSPVVREPEQPAEADDEAADITSRIGRQVAMLERNIFTLDHECSPSKINEDIDAALRAIATRTEASLQGLNQGIDEPLPLKRVDTKALVKHLDKKVLKLERAARADANVGDEHRQAYDAISAKLRRVWDGEALGASQDFDLMSFDDAVVTKLRRLGERNSILQEQLRQQREIPAQASQEHAREMADLQATHAELQEIHTDLRLRHETAQAQVEAMRVDGDNVMSELERLKAVVASTVEQKQQALDESVAALRRVDGLESELVEYRQELEEHRRAPAALREEMAGMHEKIVELTTELAESKAEADRIRGSRAERAKEAAPAPEIQARLDRLRALEDENAHMGREMRRLEAEADRKTMLERELSEMASEHRDLSRETVEAEKEREQLEGVVDRLRERCESLESRLEEEKVQSLGAAAGADGGRASVSTSTAMLRAEFKKMIRATRAESDKKLKAEQDERRRLEVQLRELRRERLAALRV